jgi:pre-mRNA-processing factor 19
MPVSSTSLPSLIQSFEREWDRVLVESYNLKAKLHSAQEDLAKALYEQEASIRLVADLQRQRDQALDEIAKLQEELAGSLQ